MRDGPLRALGFVVICALTLYVPFSLAEPPRAPPVPPIAKAKDGGAEREKEGGAAPAAAKTEASKAADAGVSVSEARGDGGKVFRFGEVEIEGRMKSPQLIYFLRRVRAEFTAGDLGHRSFQRELSDTRNDPRM